MSSQQVIAQDLWAEFQQELVKAEQYQNTKVSLTAQNKYSSHAPFWEAFLNTQFPMGSINKVLEKNFAIWMSLNKIPIEKVKEAYNRNKWGIAPLMGWLKEVQEGKISSYNSGEVVLWTRQNNRPDLESLLPPEDLGMPKTEFNVLTDAELQDYFAPTIEWRVQNFIRPKSIIIVGAKRSGLKSWFMLNLSYCVASGKSFLDKYETQKGAVLYLDKENGLSELKTRSPMVKKGLGILDNLSNFYYVSECPLKLDKSLDLEAIERLIIDKQISLIIVDTYRRFISFEENDANEVSKFFVDTLKPFCERTGVAVVFIHHEKKGKPDGDEMDMLRGSSDLANFVDGIIQIERNGENMLIKQTKSRGARELEPFRLKVETDETTYFKFVYAGEPQSAEQMIAKKITDWLILNKMKQVRHGEIKEYVGKTSNLSGALELLQSSGILTKGTLHNSPYIVNTELLSGGVCI